MRSFLTVILVATLLLVGCGEDRTVCIQQGDKRECHTYVQYGLLNQDDRDPNVQYKVIRGNVFWGIVLFASVVAPVIIFGWYVYEPVGPKPNNEPNGSR